MMKKKPKLSVTILTKNEEKNIADCIASLQWADEVVVFDSFSQDRTVEIAREAGATVFQHPFQNFAQQRNAIARRISARSPSRTTRRTAH